MDEVLSLYPQRYAGKRQPAPHEQDSDGRPLRPYLPSPELVEAVNLAIYLERPLLLKGEPGSGKTQLARAVAYELDAPHYPWYVKSTSRARDGLYLYDAVQRLRDAQLAPSGRLSEEELRRINDPEAYIQPGPLGKAFASEKQSVVLIDEIDKADIDFPNDLLIELDEMKFRIEETGRTVIARQTPIIFVTSNDEKDLPDAFLRRCLFHYVTFPPAEQLIKIVQHHVPEASPRIVEAAVRRFSQLREQMIGRGDARKRVSTSELLDWFRIIRNAPEEKALKLLDGQLPFPSVLLKSWEDHRRFLSEAGR